MALSNAERQRRYREKKRARAAERRRAEGAHSGPPTASDPPAAVTRNTSDVTPADRSPPELGFRGRWLWEQITDGGTVLPAADRVLLEETCRTADRLDQLDRILRGVDEAWLRFRANSDGDQVTVVVNQALAEARQQQTTLARLLADLRQAQAGAGGKPAGRGGKPAPATNLGGAGGGGGIIDLVAEAAKRRENATG